MCHSARWLVGDRVDDDLSRSRSGRYRAAASPTDIERVPVTNPLRVANEPGNSRYHLPTQHRREYRALRQSNAAAYWDTQRRLCEHRRASAPRGYLQAADPSDVCQRGHCNGAASHARVSPVPRSTFIDASHSCVGESPKRRVLQQPQVPSRRRRRSRRGVARKNGVPSSVPTG
jgi:hypothetical protein